MRKKKNKNIAGVLALFFGWFGAHRFYLGQNDRGWTFAVLTGLAMWGGRIPVVGRLLALIWLPVVMIIALVDAISLFAMDGRRFDEKYNGIPFDRRDRSTDFDRKDRSTDFERPTQKKQERRQAPPRRQQRQEKRQARRTQKASPRQSQYNKTGKAKFAEYDYEGAIEEFKKTLELNPADIAAHFNLACAYSLTENVEKSFYHLELAVAHGFQDLKKIQEHHALAYLRIQPEFEDFVKNEYRMPRIEKEVIEEKQEEDLLASQPDLLDQLNKLAEMRKQGFLTEKEFETRKEILLQKTQ